MCSFVRRVRRSRRSRKRRSRRRRRRKRLVLESLPLRIWALQTERESERERERDKTNRETHMQRGKEDDAGKIVEQFDPAAAQAIEGRKEGREEGGKEGRKEEGN